MHVSENLIWRILRNFFWELNTALQEPTKSIIIPIPILIYTTKNWVRGMEISVVHRGCDPTSSPFLQPRPNLERSFHPVQSEPLTPSSTPRALFLGSSPQPATLSLQSPRESGRYTRQLWVNLSHTLKQSRDMCILVLFTCIPIVFDFFLKHGRYRV